LDHITAIALDALFARVADEELPEAMDSDDGVLPRERERLALRWGQYVRRSPRAERK